MFTKNYYAALNNAFFPGTKVPAKFSNGVWTTSTPELIGDGDHHQTGYAGSHIPYGFYFIGTLKTDCGDGVTLGQGTTPATPDDYKIEGPIVKGYESFVKTFMYPESKKNGAYEQKAIYTITNPTKEPITITEICYYARGWLLDRTILPSPLVIEPNGGIGKLTYSLINTPITCLPEDGVNIDDNDVYSLSKCIYDSGHRRLGACRDFAGIKWGESSPFDNISPWKDMKRYNLTETGEIGVSEDSETFDPKLETMVYIPEFYYYSNYGNMYTASVRLSISPSPKKGYVKHPGSGRYVGRFLASQDESGIYRTITGKTPKINDTLANYRKIHSRNSHLWMMDIATASALYMLMAIEGGSTILTDFFGGGATGNPANEVTGQTAFDQYGTPYDTYGSLKIGNHVSYRWIEDVFLYDGMVCDGIKIENNELFYGLNNAEFSDPNLEKSSYSYGPLSINSGADKQRGYYLAPDSNGNLFLPICGNSKIPLSVNSMGADFLTDGEGARFTGPADDWNKGLYKNRIVIPPEADDGRQIHNGGYYSRHYSRAQRATTLIYVP